MISKEMNKGDGCTGIIYFLLLIGNYDFNERGYRQCHHDWRGIGTGGIYKDSYNTKIFNEQNKVVDVNLKFTIYFSKNKANEVCLLEVFKTFK